MWVHVVGVLDGDMEEVGKADRESFFGVAVRFSSGLLSFRNSGIASLDRFASACVGRISFSTDRTALSNAASRRSVSIALRVKVIQVSVQDEDQAGTRLHS